MPKRKRQLTESNDIALARAVRAVSEPLSLISKGIKILEGAELEADAHQLRRAWLILNKWKTDIKNERATAERMAL